MMRDNGGGLAHQANLSEIVFTSVISQTYRPIAHFDAWFMSLSDPFGVADNI